MSGRAQGVISASGEPQQDKTKRQKDGQAHDSSYRAAMPVYLADSAPESLHWVPHPGRAFVFSVTSL